MMGSAAWRCAARMVPAAVIGLMMPPMPDWEKETYGMGRERMGGGDGEREDGEKEDGEREDGKRGWGEGEWCGWVGGVGGVGGWVVWACGYVTQGEEGAKRRMGERPMSGGGWVVQVGGWCRWVGVHVGKQWRCQEVGGWCR